LQIDPIQNGCPADTGTLASRSLHPNTRALTPLSEYSPTVIPGAAIARIYALANTVSASD